MGEVYIGYDEKLERRVALKSIRAEHRLDQEAKARFLREARVLSQLEHPNICQIYDYLDGALALREELLDPNHPDVATSLNNPGTVYMDRGWYEEAGEGGS